MKKINHTYLILFCTVLIVNIAVAQDQHLTQYYNNEVFINPSLAGSNNGQLRVSANTKQQWNSIGSAYSTSVLAVDKSVMTSSKMTVAGGLIFMSDKMGDSKFKPGEWKAVNATGQDLKQQIFPLPVREPSAVLLQAEGRSVV